MSTFNLLILIILAIVPGWPALSNPPILARNYFVASGKPFFI